MEGVLTVTGIWPVWNRSGEGDSKWGGGSVNLEPGSYTDWWQQQQYEMITIIDNTCNTYD